MIDVNDISKFTDNANEEQKLKFCLGFFFGKTSVYLSLGSYKICKTI